MKLRTFDTVRLSLAAAASTVAFDAPSHTYRRATTRLPSVTQVLRHFFPDAYARVPADVLERKRQIGIAAHAATHLLDRGVLDDATVADAVRPYLESWRLFVAEHQVQVIATELRLGHPARDYAGTIDKVVWMPGALSTITVLDLKTGAPAAAKTHLQTAAYAELVRTWLDDPGVFVRRAAVQLDAEGGRAKLTPYLDRHDFRRFAVLREALAVIQEESDARPTSAVA